MEPTGRAIRDACNRNDFELATTVALRAWGAEILGWLVQRMRDETSASDVFSSFAERLWSSWEQFGWRCSARAWMYTLARNEANTYEVGARRDRQRWVPLSRMGAVSAVVDEVRTETLPYLRTSVKDEFRALREHLSEEDQTILVLRVDRELSWSEIAQITLGGDVAPSDAALARETARLRKRLQLIKARIRALAEEAGLL